MTPFRSFCVLGLFALAACGGRTPLEQDDGASPAVLRADAGLPPCKGGLTQCGQRNVSLCSDLSQSHDNCGACGHACPLGIACQAGVCQQFRCQGPLTFNALPEVTTNSAELRSPYGPALGDFDGDGILDLVGAPEIVDAGGVLRGALMLAGTNLLYGAGDGTFPTARRIETAKVQDWQDVAADLDGDGVLDLVSIHKDLRAVNVRRGSGNRGVPLGQVVPYPTSQPPSSLLVADLSSDGRPDLVAVVGSRLEIWRGQGAGDFKPPVSLPARGEVQVIQSVDWNRDGALDLVYGSPNLHLRYGRGDGTFASEMVCGLALPNPTVTPLHMMADLDHDGLIDMAGPSGVLLGLDDCVAKNVVPITDWEPTSPSVSLEIADLDGDGNLDILKGSQVYLGDGKGGFAKLGFFLSGGDALLVGDVNRDRKLDVITVRPAGWRVFLNACQ